VNISYLSIHDTKYNGMKNKQDNFREKKNVKSTLYALMYLYCIVKVLLSTAHPMGIFREYAIILYGT